MTTSLFATQEAVYSALTASAALQALIGNPARVYDVVPPAAVFPYVTLGDISIRDFDTKDRLGFEQLHVIHVFSRSRGRKELKQVMQTIYDVMHRTNVSVTGADLVNCQLLSALTQQDNDGLTLRGTLRFRIVVQH